MNSDCEHRSTILTIKTSRRVSTAIHSCTLDTAVHWSRFARAGPPRKLRPFSTPSFRRRLRKILTYMYNFLRSCVAEVTCSAGPVVENFHPLFDLSLTAQKNN